MTAISNSEIETNSSYPKLETSLSRKPVCGLGLREVKYRVSAHQPDDKPEIPEASEKLLRAACDRKRKKFEARWINEDKYSSTSCGPQRRTEKNKQIRGSFPFAHIQLLRVALYEET